MTRQAKRWTRPPWSFRLAQFLNGHRIRGGYRLLNLAAARGWLDGCVRYQLSPRVALQVPLYRPENRWSLGDVLVYETRLVTAFVERLRCLPGPLRLVDCGADIGTLSALLAAKLEALSEVHAFEPNREAFELLQENVALMGCRARAYQAAVGEFSGRGELRSPNLDSSAHARFVVPAETGQGAFDVLRIDDLDLPGEAGLAIKVDVEGGELAVLRGARGTLARIPNWVVAFEAHHDVFERTGVDPCEVLRYLAGIRPVGHLVAERRELALDPARPFFEQVQSPRIANLVCWSLQAP